MFLNFELMRYTTHCQGEMLLDKQAYAVRPKNHGKYVFCFHLGLVSVILNQPWPLSGGISLTTSHHHLGIEGMPPVPGIRTENRSRSCC